MWNDYRPNIQLPKTAFQKWLNLIGYGLFIGATIYSFVSLFSLPSEVPVHFNFAGEADGWGSKYMLLLLPIITAFLVLVLEAVEKHPHTHNYPQRLNETNVHQFYALSIRTVNTLKNGTLILFGLLQIEIVLAASKNSFTFGVAMPILTAFIVIVPIVWHIVSARKIH